MNLEAALDLVTVVVVVELVVEADVEADVEDVSWDLVVDVVVGLNLRLFGSLNLGLELRFFLMRDDFGSSST